MFSALPILSAVLILTGPSPELPGPRPALKADTLHGECFAAAPTSTQDARRISEHLWLGLELQTGLLVGDASDFLDSGFGLQGSVRWYAQRWIAARATIGFLALSEGRDELSGVTTDNTILNLLVGPELILHIGPVEPHLFGAVGLAINFLNAEGPAGSIDETDTAFAYGGGGGLRVVVHSGRHPLALQANAAIVDAGELDFATLSVGGPSARDQDMVSLLLSIGLSLGID